MKYLSNYIDEPLTKLFKECGAFYAFSSTQFEEKRRDGTKYIDCKNGLICEEQHVPKLINGMHEIIEEGRKQDLKDNGKEAIILRELLNHECFYTSYPDDAIEALEGYNFTEQEIRKIFKDNWHKYGV